MYVLHNMNKNLKFVFKLIHENTCDIKLYMNLMYENNIFNISENIDNCVRNMV